MALRVSISSDYKTLLENAKERWKNVWKNLYQEGKKYALLLEDGHLFYWRNLSFLKGTRKR